MTANIFESEPKLGGVLRITTQRVVEARCTACRMGFQNTGAAASHARTARHPVSVDYRTTFTFMPREVLEQNLSAVHAAEPDEGKP